MKLALTFSLIVGFTAVGQGSDNSTQVTLEGTPGDQQPQTKALIIPDA